ncbi:hypothetical protein V8F20_003441 [Naviculisporaceae sp. PSN 640]
MPSWKKTFSIKKDSKNKTIAADSITIGTIALPTRADTERVELYKPARPDRIIGSVNVYNLDWDELEGFLKKRFPGVTDFSGTSGKFESTEDHYVIYTPQVLTAEDREEIDVIRKAHRERAMKGGERKKRAEHSPDGPRRPVGDDE